MRAFFIAFFTFDALEAKNQIMYMWKISTNYRCAIGDIPRLIPLRLFSLFMCAIIVSGNFCRFHRRTEDDQTFIDMWQIDFFHRIAYKVITTINQIVIVRTARRYKAFHKYTISFIAQLIFLHNTKRAWL